MSLTTRLSNKISIAPYTGIHSVWAIEGSQIINSEFGYLEDTLKILILEPMIRIS